MRALFVVFQNNKLYNRSLKIDMDRQRLFYSGFPLFFILSIGRGGNFIRHSHFL